MEQNSNLTDSLTKIEKKEEDLIKPEASLIPDERSFLSDEVAISRELKDWENKKIVFTFLNYEPNKCEIYKLQSPEAKKLTETLRLVNKTSTKHIKDRTKSGFDCTSVGNNQNYSVYFDNIPKDAELLEIHYTKPGRVFGYLSENIFNITVVKKVHTKYD